VFLLQEQIQVEKDLAITSTENLDIYWKENAW